MYAIIEDGGKQYKVEEGAMVCVDVRDLAEGQTEVEFDRILLVRDGDDTLVGQPILAGAKVVGKISGEAADTKLYPMQFRRRKDSQRRIGHRQKYLAVEITSISKP
ncbi:MAG: 50S ribosomal protein L21 [Sedimentisphaerales bacterium]|nr:50S ribosomal protein L21 [Sedimentisphaerales bacterium]